MDGRVYNIYSCPEVFIEVGDYQTIIFSRYNGTYLKLYSLYYSVRNLKFEQMGNDT